MTLIDDEPAAPPAGARRAGRDDAPQLVTALAGAFYDDPVFRWFSPDDSRRRAMLPAFFDVVVAAYLEHGEAYTDGAGAGAALWAPPGIDPLGADTRYAERLEAIAGVDAPALFEAIQLLEAHAPRDPHHHLQFLGVRPERQGTGIGGAVIAPTLADCDRACVPGYLEATSDRNRALYERHGFRVRTEIPLREGPTMWGMWRDPARL